METWKLIAAGILIFFGFNLLFYGHVKRRIAAAKAEGYRRQVEQVQEDTQEDTSTSSDLNNVN